MKATSSAENEFQHGRTPQEMSRPMTTTRNGFMESHGCGMQVIMNARLALDMGVPIHGVVAFTNTASDKIGRSVPAPGKGVLTTARETPTPYPSPLLDIKYRKRQMDLRRKQIKQWQESELMYMQEEVNMLKAQDSNLNEKAYMEDRAACIAREAHRQNQEVLYSLGNNFWKQDDRIAPLRGALATWGLTIDDLGFATLHGTSTQANDKNESDVICQQMEHLGRAKGNSLLVVTQKWMTGHPKAAAGAWMYNSASQILDTGLVPGNRNADNIDPALEKFDYLVYPSRSIQTDGIKAFSVTSFGFGQKGAQAIGVHVKYLFATLSKSEYQTYKGKVEARQKKAYRYFSESMINNNLFRAKDKPPYEDNQESSVFLDPTARVSMDKKSNKFAYPATAPSGGNKKATAPSTEKKDDGTKEIVESLAAAGATGTANSKVGVDVEKITEIPVENTTFINRNFTAAEQSYCQKSAKGVQAAFAGRWSAKEAVFKSLGVESRGGGASLKDIEIVSDEKGVPAVKVSLSEP